MMVRQAFADPSGQSFWMQVEVDEHEARLLFEDDGRPFDPTTWTVPTRLDSIDQAMPGGLGLPLLRRRTRWMRYERRDGRNRLSLGVALSA